MASEGLGDEEWEAGFLDEVFRAVAQVEEQAFPTQSTQQKNHLPTATPSTALPRPAPAPQLPVSYSPPRELSQRIHETRQTSCITDSVSSRRTHTANEREVDTLKVNFIFEFALSIGMMSWRLWEVLMCVRVWLYVRVSNFGFLMSAKCNYELKT